MTGDLDGREVGSGIHSGTAGDTDDKRPFASTRIGERATLAGVETVLHGRQGPPGGANVTPRVTVVARRWSSKDMRGSL
jgi:hypothetical protein